MNEIVLGNRSKFHDTLVEKGTINSLEIYGRADVPPEPIPIGPYNRDVKNENHAWPQVQTDSTGLRKTIILSRNDMKFELEGNAEGKWTLTSQLASGEDFVRDVSNLDVAPGMISFDVGGKRETYFANGASISTTIALEGEKERLLSAHVPDGKGATTIFYGDSEFQSFQTTDGVEAQPFIDGAGNVHIMYDDMKTNDFVNLTIAKNGDIRYEFSPLYYG